MPPPETSTQLVAPDATRQLTTPHGTGYEDSDADSFPPAYRHPVFTTGQQVMARRRRRGLVVGTLAVLLAVAAAVGGWLATSGPQTGTPVPTVEGLTQAQAETALHKAGLNSRVRRGFDDDTAVGRVADSDPGQGRRVPANSTVTLVVSRGPEHVPVPELEGETVPAAQKLLGRVGLRLGQRRLEYDADVPAGQIYRQDPQAGDGADNGSAVDVEVSLGARPVDVPDVEGRSVLEATRTLKRRGFLVKVDRKKAYDADSSPGQVATQDPQGGTKLAPGRTVTLVVSLGPKLVRLPDVTGSTVAQAEAKLRQAGFTPRSIGTDVLDQVLWQRPEGGTLAPQGATVTLGTL
jgi:beta-lactam-binding protein with PASTA domain